MSGMSPDKLLEDSSGDLSSLKTRSTEAPMTKGDSKDLQAEEHNIHTNIQQPQDSKKNQDGEEALRPNEVTCDSCIDRPCLAKKSCLTCLVSYCETHLRPHLENVKFQSHKLVEPLRDIERRTCEAHRCPLELFCSSDACCVCHECVTEQHRGHQTMPVTAARKKIEKELQDKQIYMLKTATAAEKAISKLQVNTVSIEVSVQSVRDVVQEQFTVLLSVIEQVQKEVSEILDVEERQALRQAEGIRVHLEQRCTELKKTHSHIEKILTNKNDIDFLQEYSQCRKEALDVPLPGVYIGLMDRMQTFSHIITQSTKDLCDSLLTFYPNKLRDSCKNENAGIKTTVHTITADKQGLSSSYTKTRDDFLKHFTPLTFDGDTAHQFLRLTDERKKVTNTTPWQHSYPDLIERFAHFRQVLTVESVYLGQHYFEMDIRGEGTHVGVTYKSIDRKGSECNSCITGNEFSWCLQWNGRSFSAWHSNVETPLSIPKATRIGIFVDYSCGLLAFYDVENHMTLIHKYYSEFQEPLYSACWLPKKENVVLLVEAGAPSVQSSLSQVSTPP